MGLCLGLCSVSSSAESQLHVVLELLGRVHAAHGVACRVGRVFKKRQCNSWTKGYVPGYSHGLQTILMTVLWLWSASCIPPLPRLSLTACRANTPYIQ